MKGMIFFLLVGAILGALSVIFVLQNIVPITVTFLTWQIEGSLAVVLFLAMMSGMFVGLLMILPGLIRDEFRYSKLRQEKKEVEDELTTTRKVINEVAVNTAAAGPTVL